MKTEIEARILDIDESELISKLEKAGAKKINVYNQRRFVYDFLPVIPNKWIRLRDDGVNVTLTIKEIKNDLINGTK